MLTLNMRINTVLIFMVTLFSASTVNAQSQQETTGSENQQPNPHDMSRESIKQAFSSLSLLDLPAMLVAYNGSAASVINKKRSELDRSHPLFVDDALEKDDILLMQTRLIDTNSQTFYVLFSEGPSADPSFYFIKTNSPGKVWADLPGTAIAIPGNGTVYVANRYNDTFTRRTKYLYATTALIEVPQPFYYVGLKTQTLMPISLYTTPDEKHAVAQLPKGSEIEVLLADTRLSRQNMTCFLIKTPFGLVGWSWVPEDQYHSKAIEGISFWGD